MLNKFQCEPFTASLFAWILRCSTLRSALRCTQYYAVVHYAVLYAVHSIRCSTLRSALRCT